LREALPEVAVTSISLVLSKLAAASNPLLGTFATHFTKALLSALLSKQDEATLLLTTMARAPYRAALVELDEALSIPVDRPDEQDYCAKRCLQALGHLDLAAEQCPDADRLIVTFWKGLASLHIPGGLHSAARNLNTFADGASIRADHFELSSREKKEQADLLDPLTRPPRRTKTPVEKLLTFTDGFSGAIKGEDTRSISRPQGMRFDTTLDKRAQNRLRHSQALKLRRQAEEEALIAAAYSDMSHQGRALAAHAHSRNHAKPE
jgi:hypothetical protein